jgi:hypothetical protein
MKLIAISIVAWLIGLGAYLFVALVLWGQPISSGDLRAVVVGSGVVAALSAVLLFAPVMFVLRKRAWAQRAGASWVFTVCGVILGVVPVVLIISFWSKDIVRALASSEAGLFYCMFGPFGASYGIAFYRTFVRDQV